MVLVETSRVIKKLLRVTDVVGRSDTQDFLILMPETEADGARMLGERILQTVSQYQFQVEKKSLPVTVSIGVACSPGGDLTENLALVGRAEAAIDRAKQSGKNRLEIA